MTWQYSDTINAVTAGLLFITILISLYLGLKSIDLTRKQAQQRYRFQLLNEVSRWCIDILANCNRILLSNLHQHAKEIPLFADWRDVVARYQTVYNALSLLDRKLNRLVMQNLPFVGLITIFEVVIMIFLVRGGIVSVFKMIEQRIRGKVITPIENRMHAISEPVENYLTEWWDETKNKLCKPVTWVD